MILCNNALAQEKHIDWQRVVCFNMDDFYAPKIPEACTCGHQTRTRLYDKVHPRRAYLVGYNAPDPQVEARRFEALLRAEGQPDILCQGIGTSGHLALNEPGDTDFADTAWVRVIRLAEQSKFQLAADPNFQAIGNIPAIGITMTIPALLSARSVYTMIPLVLKRPILEKLAALQDPTTERPASILLQNPGTLYVDRDSSPRKWLPHA